VPIASRVKRVTLLALIVFAAAGTTVGSASTSSPSAVLKQEAAYLNTRNWKPYYALMGPRFRASCNFSTFVARNESVRKQIKSASIDKVSTKYAGSKAYLSYETVAPPLKPFMTKNDLFVKISGRWYDEFDAVTRC
jgi:hypothetical protein